jgi:hypothetical protein
MPALFSGVIPPNDKHGSVPVAGRATHQHRVLTVVRAIEAQATAPSLPPRTSGHWRAGRNETLPMTRWIQSGVSGAGAGRASFVGLETSHEPTPDL